MKRLLKLLSRRRAAVERSFFDPAYYRRVYPDVAPGLADAFAHFMAHGWLEGRNPSAAFVTLYYRDRHLGGQRINPLTHYAEIGAARELETAPPSIDAYIAVQAGLARAYFSESFYRAQRSGIQGDLLTHYLRVGWKEGLAPNAAFEASSYTTDHGYIRSLDVCPLYHFASQQRILYGKEDPETRDFREARGARLLMDARIRDLLARDFESGFYLQEHADVRTAGIDPLDHYIRHGWRENRKPNRYFDSAFYLADNPIVAQSGINPFYHYLAFGRTQGLRPNPVGTAQYPPMAAPADEVWQRLRPASDASDAACVVILPVYKGYGETLAALTAILGAEQETRFALVVINDRSPDARLTEKLRALAARNLFLYEEHASNQGFVKTVNAGLRRFESKDVVLVNTDAKVSGNWLDRMLAHARRDPMIATITPFSNNATILSYPLRNVNNMVQMEVDAAELDRLAAICNKGRASDIPVGVGFCLFISAASRSIVGLLDEETFGRGYGDENDYCIRANRAGFRNVLAEDVFVYHVGEVSFGAPQERRRIRGQKELIAKHPDYGVLIDLHLRNDTAAEGRMRLDLIRLARAAGDGCHVHVTHALGGGVSKHVEDEIRALRRRGTPAIVVRLGLDPWSLEIDSGDGGPYCPNLKSISIIRQRALLEEFLQWLAPAVIHVHSLVGLNWISTTAMLDLIAGAGCPYRFTLHDYSVVCHRHTLLRPNGRYCGLPDVAACRDCIAGDESFPEAVDPSLRRSTFGRFLEGADAVFAPSQDIATRLRGAGAAYRILVRPHEEEGYDVPTVVEAPKAPEFLTLVVLGAIGQHKGSRLLLSLARDALTRGLPIRFRIVGYSDIPGELEEVGVTETGRYEGAREAFAHIAEIKPSYIFLPSIWPETYGYALSLAFATGCPPIVFDIGALAERVRDAVVGIVLPYDLVFHIKALNNRLLEIHDLAFAQWQDRE